MDKKTNISFLDSIVIYVGITSRINISNRRGSLLKKKSIIFKKRLKLLAKSDNSFKICTLTYIKKHTDKFYKLFCWKSVKSNVSFTALKEAYEIKSI